MRDKVISKGIEVVDIIEKLYKLDRELESLPKLAGSDRVAFRVTVDSIGDLISLADQYNTHFFEPSALTMYHWCIINIGDNVSLHLETPRELYKITY